MTIDETPQASWLVPSPVPPRRDTSHFSPGVVGGDATARFYPNVDLP